MCNHAAWAAFRFEFYMGLLCVIHCWNHYAELFLKFINNLSKCLQKPVEN